jgi:hypothetical protein
MRSIKLILIILVTNTFSSKGQIDNLYKKGQVQITVGFGLMPVKQKKNKVGFSYTDGDEYANYLVDTITANYYLKNKYFGNTLNIGLGYLLTDRISTTISIKPYLHSFLSNSDKNGKVYGIQFDAGFQYHTPISKEVNISLGTTVSRIIGGFGITSGGPKNKDYLVINENKLYDDDIGFHIIDNCWAISPTIGLNYRANNFFTLYLNSGYQIAFGRSSRMNFAGLQKDGSIKWNKKSFDDENLSLTIDNTKINRNTIDKLPYKFEGIRIEIGAMITINK